MPTIITEWQERRPIHDEMRVILPPLPEWKVKYPWLVSNSYKVKRADFEEAEKLSNKLFNYYQKTEKLSDNEVEEIISRLRAFKLPSAEEKGDPAFWNRVAAYMPNLSGTDGSEITKLLSGMCSGLVLEALCGYESYLEEKKDMTVIALDFAELALGRYPYPQRTRVLFDVNKDSFDNFSENCFDFITICFGFKYFKDADEVCRGFLRILKPGGKIYFLENPSREYSQATYRPFTGHECVMNLKHVGFSDAHYKWLNITDYDGQQNYYLVTGEK